MNFPEIEHLYKFRSLAGSAERYVQRILQNQELYFAKPTEFNDPFDCLPVISLQSTPTEFEAYLDGFFQRRMPHISRKERRARVKEIVKGNSKNPKWREMTDALTTSMKEAVNEAGIFSMAATCEHVLMWSHYADSHKGVCLRFRAKASTPFFGRAQPVTYQETRPVINLITDTPAEQAGKALLTKADFWSYEEEWRIVEHESGPGIHVFPSGLLDGVIFGARVTKRDRERILEWIKGNTQIELFDAEISKDKFRVTINAI